MSDMEKEEKKWAVGMLFVGLMFGVMGSLAANVLERHLISKIGEDYYGIAVGVCFIVLIIYFDRKFTKLVGLSEKDK